MAGNVVVPAQLAIVHQHPDERGGEDLRRRADGVDRALVGRPLGGDVREPEASPPGRYGALERATRSDAADRHPPRRARASVGPEGPTER